MAPESGIKFSVVVPCYNYGKGLLKLVERFAASGRKDYELLLVDDGSTDDTETIFSSVRDPQVRYLRKKNEERGAARNYGADRARGTYVCFFDQDDHPFPHFFEEASRCIAELGAPDVFCVGMEVRDRHGKLLKAAQNLPDPLNDRLLKGNLFGCGGIFVKTGLTREVRFEEDRGIVGTEDWLFKLRLAARHQIRYWPKTCWAYIDTGENSVYRFSEKDLNSRAVLLEKHLRADPVFMAKFGSRISEIVAFRDVYTALHLALLGGTSRPLYYLLRALKTDYRGTLRAATLGTIKNVARNLATGKSAK